jgi:hypothetical protein
MNNSAPQVIFLSNFLMGWVGPFQFFMVWNELRCVVGPNDFTLSSHREDPNFEAAPTLF